MAVKTVKTGKTTKRPSKSQRTHTRRVKQAASKDTINKVLKVRRVPAKIAAE